MISERRPRAGEIWRHHNGELVVVVTLGADCDRADREFVVFREMNTEAHRVCLLDRWNDVVSRRSARDGTEETRRFEPTAIFQAVSLIESPPLTEGTSE